MVVWDGGWPSGGTLIFVCVWIVLLPQQNRTEQNSTELAYETAVVHGDGDISQV
jgi:hypothetical protein